MDILRLEGVVKAYEKHLAVDNVSFAVPRGSIFGLLGPNGAGKTSIIRIITTITRPDAGRVWLDGEPLHGGHPADIGYMPEERGLYKKMKVGEHIMYLARLKGLTHADAKREIDHWFGKFEIGSWWDKKVEELSKGMQQKIQFIATVIHRPKLLILDEPFSGLDPINANLIRDEIDELRRQGTSIIFSTHRMEQVEEICDQMVLISQGRNILEGGVKDIKYRFREHLFHLAFDGPLPEALAGQLDIVRQKEGRVVVHLREGQSSNDLLQVCLAQGLPIREFHEILPSINEIFIKQVNEGALSRV